MGASLEAPSFHDEIIHEAFLTPQFQDPNPTHSGMDFLSNGYEADICPADGFISVWLVAVGTLRSAYCAEDDIQVISHLISPAIGGNKQEKNAEANTSPLEGPVRPRKAGAVIVLTQSSLSRCDKENRPKRAGESISIRSS